MNTVLHILIPTDYSPNAYRATKFGINMAKRMKSKVTLLHAYHISTGAVEDMMFLDKFREEEEERMDKELKDFRAEFPGVQINGVVKYGSAVDNLESEVDRLKADLVVMGTKGETSAIDALLGSVASHAINELDVAVLVVPQEYRESTIKEVMFATDLSQTENPSVFDPFKSILNVYDPAVDIVHITDNVELDELPGKAENSVRKQFQEYKSSFHLVEGDDIEMAVFEFASDNACDLIVVKTKHYNFMQRLFHKSVSRKLALHSTIPLLVLHD